MNFRTSFAENIFKNKYAKERNIEWADLARMLVDDVCGTMGGTKDPLLPKDTLDAIEADIRDMRFIPGGRYLYYAGRPSHAWNNCLTGDQKLLTDKGMVRLDSLVDGDAVRVYSPVSKQFELATANSHGEQPVQRITFQGVRGKSTRTWTVKATKNHHWPLIAKPTSEPQHTYDLRVGDVVPAAVVDIEGSKAGWLHGAMFADGSQQLKSNKFYYQLRLCGKKAKHVDQFSEFSTTYPPFAGGDPVIYFNSDKNLKEIPSTDDLDYLVGFIKGWVAFDGHNGGTRQLHSVSQAAIQMFMEYAHLAGFIVSGNMRVDTKDSNFGPRQPLYHCNFKDAADFQGFKVVSIEPLGVEQVYCPFEPKHNRICIDYGIDTYQCFLLRGEEDTREEWGNIDKRASDCLMSGGGIGIDYSRFRKKGMTLSKTGGESSGPIPLAHTVNELGRNVMQGGSRRSAIYGSLNWLHGDAESFLVSKNWADMPIGKAKKKDGTPYTIWDAKQDDFNYPAPLDMTNISLNYDDKFLHSVQSGVLPEMFMKNVGQALRTGEPGFSFNFGAKINETLRNAPVSQDTWVLTSRGYQQIKDVVGKEIFVWTGKQYAKTTFKKTASNASIIGVTCTGRRKIKAEPSHEFLVERWSGKGERRKLNSIDRVAAKDLKIGDVLHTSLPETYIPGLHDNDSYTMGFLYGDGSFGVYGGDCALCTPEKKALLPHFSKSLIKSVTAEDSRGYTRVYFDKTVSAMHSLNPDCPMFESLTETACFVAGLFDADGNYDPTQHRVRLSSVNYKRLEGVRRLLDYLGIRSNINKGSASGYGGRNSWSLVVVADDVNRFKKVVPCQRLKIEETTSYRAFQNKVTDLSCEPNEDVYCCDVGVEEHTFCAEGIIISNCCEVTSEDDSDVCNLGSLNMALFESVTEFGQAACRASMFLACGTLRADLPYEKVYKIREKNRRLGLGLMGVHEWLLRRGMKYEVTDELHNWLAVYKAGSEDGANEFCDLKGISRPVAYRAIAPTGTIGILAGTTTGIEPLFATAYKRRYLTDGTRWRYEYVVDATAAYIVQHCGVAPENIETAIDLAADPERRIKFQADVQGYVDMAISSTINLPSWGSPLNNPDTVKSFAATLAKYAPRLRGFTCYPDGARGGQPLVQVPYNEALKHKGVVFDEVDICEWTGKGGTCGS